MFELITFVERGFLLFFLFWDDERNGELLVLKLFTKKCVEAWCEFLHHRLDFGILYADADFCVVIAGIIWLHDFHALCQCRLVLRHGMDESLPMDDEVAGLDGLVRHPFFAVYFSDRSRWRRCVPCGCRLVPDGWTQTG